MSQSIETAQQQTDTCNDIESDVNDFGFAESDKHCICVYSKQANLLTFFIGGGLFILGIFIYNGGVIFLGIFLMLVSAVCYVSSIGYQVRKAKREHRKFRKSGSYHDPHDFVDIEAQQKLKPVCIAAPHHVFKKTLSAQGGEYRRPSVETMASESTDSHQQPKIETSSPLNSVPNDTHRLPESKQEKVAVELTEIQIQNNDDSEPNSPVVRTRTASEEINFRLESPWLSPKKA